MNEVSDVSVENSKIASSIKKRYKDAYIVSRATVRFGSLIKSIGVLLAIVVLLIAFFIASQTPSGRDGGVVLGISVISGVFGIFAGILLYLLGVLVSAQGQILKATLDGAVNTSPFLTNEHRVVMMSLQESYAAGNYEANSNTKSGKTCEVCGKQLSWANKIDSFGAPRCKEHLYTKNA